MVTYLDLANDARALEGGSPLTVDGIQLDTGDAIDTVAAVNNTYNDLIEYSTDFDFNEYVEDVTLTIGTQTVSQPSSQQAWDANVINAVKRVDSSASTGLIELFPVDLERAKDLEQTLTSNDTPRFYYINRGVLKVIPAPDDTYTIKVFYQAEPFRITKTNITNDIIFPAHFHNVFISGVHMRLRQAAGDPEWKDLEQKFYKKLNLASLRNKFGAKKNGARKFRMRRWNVDRRM